MQVLKTKLSRPAALNSAALQRPALLSRLLEYSRQSLLFIHAAAGYGKTTLMHQLSGQLAQQGSHVHWLSLDEDDNDPIRLFQYLRLSWLGAQQLSSVPEGRIQKHNVLELMEKLAQSSGQHVLFIDEFEALENPDCLDMLWWMYQCLPQNAHLVIASRIKPGWNFSKELLQGRLHVVNAEQLSVKPEDAAALSEFLKQQNFEHVQLNPELVQQLIEKTEGWMTGIQLINLCLKHGRDAGSIIQNLSGAHNQVVDYLSEQVFVQQPEEIQLFLQQMSVLRKVNPALLQEVTGNAQARHLLEQIKQRGLFILALDEQGLWYRVHHLFRSFLENRFKAHDAEKFRQAHAKAAGWHKAQHFLMEAIYHAQQAHDQALFLALLADVSRELVLDGRVYTLLELVKQLPDQALAGHPHLLYDTIWALLLTHQNAQANRCIQLWHSAEASQSLILREDQLGLAPLMALLEDNLAQAHVLAQQNLAKLPETAYFSRGPLIGIGALHQICLGNIAEARRLLIQTRATYIQGYNLYGLAFTDCIDATCERLMGNLALAEEKFSQIGKGADYQKLKIDEGNQTAIDAIASSLKADLYYEMNKIALAEQALQRFNGGDQLVIPDMVIIGYVLQLRLAHLRGDTALKQACLTQSQIRTNDWSMPRLAQTVQQVYEHQNSSGHSGAARELQPDGPLAAPNPSGPLSITSLLIGADLLTYREWIFNGNIAQALAGLQQEAQRVTVYPLRQIRIQLLQAMAHSHLAQQDTALDYLEKAVLSLMPTQALRILLDEPPLIWALLAQLSRRLLRNKPGHAAPLLEYIQQLQELSGLSRGAPVPALAEAAADAPQAEVLSKREIQILEKVSEGFTDAEISAAVFLSVNTVKWHLRNIYHKLQARSRMEAVKEAKKIGLIA